jgi:SAM-dependent methyltransferase
MTSNQMMQMQGQSEEQATHEGFYRAFLDRFFVSRELIRLRLNFCLPFIEPLKTLADRPEGVDLGCGRGEWLEVLLENGFDAQGVDLDVQMLAACDKKGLRTTCEDAISFLEKLNSHSHLLISGFHIAEHLRFSQLQILVKEALRVLKPGGLLILETLNPENVQVSTLTFYLDPTYHHPIPPELLSFMTVYYGFERTKVVRLQESCELLSSQTARLEQVMSAISPNYAVVAQKSVDRGGAQAFDRAFGFEFGLSARELSRRFDEQSAEREMALARVNVRVDELNVRADEERAELANDLAEERTARAMLERKFEALEARLDSVYNSTSWRVTAPLRFASGSARWFIHGFWAWVTLKPGSRPRRAIQDFVSKSVFARRSTHPVPARVVDERFCERERHIHARLKAALKRHELIVTSDR